MIIFFFSSQTQQSNNDFLRVQNVPRTTPPKPFRFAGQLKQLNTGEVFLVPPQTSPLQFRAQLRAPNRDGQRRKNHFIYGLNVTQRKNNKRIFNHF